MLLAILTTVTAVASPVTDHLGIQIYSLRAPLAKTNWVGDWTPLLEQTKALGIANLEGMAIMPASYDAKLKELGIKMASTHVFYQQLAANLAGTVAYAKAMGVQYAIVPSIPQRGRTLTLEEVQQAVANFKIWGAAFKAEGIMFGYHPHGPEFSPAPDGGTLFDVLVGSTPPDLVCFELDVFWAVYAGQDPVKLLAQYPDRWRLMHVKDMSKGTPVGQLDRHAVATDFVTLGTGQIDLPAVLKKAQSIGVEWYFIEDETDDPSKNIPLSIEYLKSLKL